MTRRPYPRHGHRPTLAARLLLPVVLVASDLQDTLLWLEWRQARRTARRHMRKVERLRQRHGDAQPGGSVSRAPTL